MLKTNRQAFYVLVVFLLTALILPIQHHVWKKTGEEPYPNLLAPPFDGVPKIPQGGGQETTQYSIQGVDENGNAYRLTPDTLIPKTTQSSEMVFRRNFASTPEKMQNPNINNWIYKSLIKSHPNVAKVKITRSTTKTQNGQTEKVGSSKTTVIDFSESMNK
ncbi:MAG: hypothetical protein QM571_04975 [Micrococcaceae bacterium]